MTLFLNDTFTDTNGTTLLTHVGELGATWAQHPNFSGNSSIISNRVASDSSNKLFYSSGTSPTANYTIEANIVVLSTISSDVGVLARMDTASVAWYSTTISSTGLRVIKSGAVNLATVSFAPAIGTYKLVVSVAGSSTTTLKISLQRLSDGFYMDSAGSFSSGYKLCVDASDSASPVTASGRVGVWLCASSGTDSAAIDNISADYTLALQSGSASVVTIGSSTALVTCTAATQGTSPYTYQWHRSTSSGFTPGGGNIVSGATSLTLNDTGLTSGVTYYYKLVSTDSASATVTSNEVTVVTSIDIPVSNANWFFSPYNWRISGSSFAESNNPGAYFKTVFSGASATLVLDTSNNSSLASGDYPQLGWSVDGGAVQKSQLTSGQTTLSLATGLANTTHTLELFILGAWWQGDRWNTPVSAVKITGLRLASGGSLSAPTLLPSRMILFADSNGEGYESIALGVSVANQDASVAFPLLLGRALNCEVGVVAFAAQGYVASGGGNVPSLNNSWNLYSSGRSRLVSGLLSPQPDYIVSTHGQNDGSNPASNVATVLSAWRAAAPNAKIAICAATNRNQASNISGSVSSAGDSLAKWVDTNEVVYITNGQYVNANHLTGLRGHPRYAVLLIKGLQEAFSVASTSSRRVWKTFESEMSMRTVILGSVDQSLRVLALDSSGNPLTLTNASPGLTISYVKTSNGIAGSPVSLTPVARTTPGVHRDGAITSKGSGWHEIDLPDAAITNADCVEIVLTATAVSDAISERIDLSSLTKSAKESTAQAILGVAG